MKSAKEILQSIRDSFFAPAPAVAPVVPVAPAQAAAPAPEAPVAAPAKTYKLQDGSEISIAQAGEAPAVGDSVTINGAPAPEGVLTLEDGSTITVDAAGVITAVAPAEPVTNDLSNAPAPALAPAPPAILAPVAPPSQFDAEAKFSEQSAVIEKVSTQLEEIKEKFAAQQQVIEKYEQTIKGLFDVCEKLAEMPSADPATLVASQKDRFEKTNKREERLRSFRDSVKKHKQEIN